MGVAVAHHLRQAQIDVDFLVRPTRVCETPSRYRLYCYDDGTTPILDGFRVLSDPTELAKEDYAFILLTIDGASLASDEGRALLSGIGNAIRNRATVLIVGSVGIGLRELAVGSTGLPKERVLSGRLGFLSHKVAGVSLPSRAPTDPRKLAGCDFSFRHLNESGFVIEDHNEAAHRLAALFDRCGTARCVVVPPELFALQSRAIFPLFATSELLGGRTLTGSPQAGSFGR